MSAEEQASSSNDAPIAPSPVAWVEQQSDAIVGSCDCARVIISCVAAGNADVIGFNRDFVRVDH